MEVREYLQYDLTGLAELITRREVTAGEVLEAAIERMAEVNPRLNAVVLDLSDRARGEAAAPLEGRFAGAPYLVKQHGAQVEGTATTLGCRVFENLAQPRDSAIVAALRRAGLVILGKTNLPEMSNDAVTESDLYGPARNPWSLDHTPGGSSGGSAAAVAGGIVPAAHGSDGGGSIRIPASCTGLFGFKPSRGRVSFAPAGEGGGGFVVQHALTRSVRDSAALLDAVCEPQPGDPYWLPRPEKPFAQEVANPPARLKIAFSTKAILADKIAEPCARAVEEAARLCEAIGHDVEEADLDAEFPAAASGLITAVSIAATLDAEAKRRGRPIGDDEIDPITRSIYERGLRASGPEYVQALQACHAFMRRMAVFFEHYDVFINATLAKPPLRIGELRGNPPDIAGYPRRLLDFMPNTKAANIGGQPAMSVPLAWTADGLPLGVQFTAAAGEDALLFRLAGQLEQARPWAGRRPPQFS